MRAFRYRLAAVLKRAQHAEQILQIELARLEDHLADALHRLHTLRRIRDDFHTRLRRLQSAPHPTRSQATPSPASTPAAGRRPSPTRVPQASACSTASPTRVPQASACSPVLRDFPSVAVDLGRVVSLRRELERLDRALAHAALLRRQLEDRVAAARARLLDAARARQLFENHRDGLARTHRHTQLAAETKHLDELANARFANNTGPGGSAPRARPSPAPPPRSGESGP